MSRHLRDLALATANRLVEILRPHCDRIEIAGSIRRNSVTVKDIELVVAPKMFSPQQSLFGEAEAEKSLVTEYLDQMVRDGLITKRQDDQGRTCWGEKHQRAVFEGIPVDVFQVIPPAEWGVIMAIRTGPGDYSKQLVTPKPYGHMPSTMKVSRGALWMLDPETGEPMIRLSTPEEADFFDAVGIPMPDPENRLARVLV